MISFQTPQETNGKTQDRARITNLWGCRSSNAVLLDMKSRNSGRFSCIVQKFSILTSRAQVREAIDTLPLLSRKGIRLKSKVIAALIQQCASEKSIESGKLVDLHLKLTGRKRPNIFVSNHLIDMYAKCGHHSKAREVFDGMGGRNLYSWNMMLSDYANLGMVWAAKELFDKMPERDIVSCNTMVKAYVQSGLFHEALSFFMELRRMDVEFNERSFAGGLTVCVKLKELWLTKQLHCLVFLSGFLTNMILCSSIIDAYAKCGEMRDAENLFIEMERKDIFVWTTLISGHAQAGDMRSARAIFYAMPEKNSVSWNALISGYARNGMERESLKSFSEMIQREIEPDQYTYSSCLLTCASLQSPEHGRQLHSHIITSGFRPNVAVVSSLIRMYSACSRLEVAKRVFGEAKNKRHAELWNTMISALSNHGCGKQAIWTFCDMLRLGVRPDRDTFLILLGTCWKLGSVDEGLRLYSMPLHSRIITSGFGPDVAVVSSLIGMHSACGRLEVAQRVFGTAKNKHHTTLWNTMISAFSDHGCGTQAIATFCDMLRSGVRPDSNTFLILLNTCRRSGFVEEGLLLFESMNTDFGIAPKDEHHACITDLVNQSGCPIEQLNQLKEMPCKVDGHVSNPIVAAEGSHG